MQSADKKYFAQNKGINTEAPLVAWPAGFTIDEQNFDLLADGSRRRRPGLQPEALVTEVVPPDPIIPPIEGDPNCFNQYTVGATLTRTFEDGFTADPDLQFETAANTSYWIHGEIQFKMDAIPGGAGVYMYYDHDGTTTAFQSMTCPVGFVPTTYTSAGMGDNWSPISKGTMATWAHGGYSSDLARTTRVWVDVILVVGATPGVFSIKWGTNKAGGVAKILAGSRILSYEIVQE